MSAIPYKLINLVCVLGIISGIRLRNSQKTARTGNLLGAACILIAIITTMIDNEIISLNVLWISMALGAVAGCLLAVYVSGINLNSNARELHTPARIIFLPKYLLLMDNK